MSLEIFHPHPVPEALRAIAGGKYGLKELHIVNPFTNEHSTASTVKGYSGETLLLITAPNGISYWDLNGKHICGFEPEGTRPEGQLTPEQIAVYNAFIEIIWSGAR